MAWAAFILFMECTATEGIQVAATEGIMVVAMHRIQAAVTECIQVVAMDKGMDNMEGALDTIKSASVIMDFKVDIIMADIISNKIDTFIEQE